MLRLDDITANIGDYTSDAILITLAEPFDEPGPMIVWCNKAFTAETGYELHEIRGKSPRILQGPETDREALRRMGRELRAWREVRAVVKNYRKDGSTFWSDIQMRPVADSSGWYRFWVSIQRNVTAQKEGELTLAARVEALRSATRRLEAERADIAGVAAVAELSNDLVSITDTEFRIQWANPAFLRRNGFALEDVRGHAYCDLMGKSSEFYASREIAIRALAAGAFSPGETLNTTPEGEEYWTEVHLSAERDENGRPTRFIVVERDITEARRMREELLGRRDHLQELVDERTRVIREQSEELSRALKTQTRLNEQQIQFIRMASHEFRTPMSVISMAARQIRRRLGADAPAAVLDKVATIDDSVARLTKLVESTLFLAKADAGHFEFHVRAVDIAAWLAERVAQERAVEGAHEVAFDNRCPEGAVIAADPNLLDHIFDNLISNAKKYSPDAARIEIAVWKEDGAARISVRDFGVGVPEADLPKLGERYFRASTAHGVAGTGIGLSVVKQFVDLHGGALAIESVEGAGSTFTVMLPLRDDAPAEAAPQMETAR